jgi:hypothetical protein
VSLSPGLSSVIASLLRSPGRASADTKAAYRSVLQGCRAFVIFSFAL